MALKRWHQAGIVATAMALAMVIVLPPRPEAEVGETGWVVRTLFEGGVPTASGRHHHDDLLAGTVATLRDRRAAIRMADSVLQLARGPRTVRSADGSLTLVYQPSLTADSARVWLELFERELSLAPRGPHPGVPLVVALSASPRIGSGRGEIVPRDSWGRLRLISWRPERPACITLIRLQEDGYDRERLIERDRKTGVARSRVFDWCLAFARFGLPGQGLRGWTGPPLLRFLPWSLTRSDLSWALEIERGHNVGQALGLRGRQEEWPDYWTSAVSTSCARSGGLPCLRSVGMRIDESMQYQGFFIGLSRRLLLARLMLADSARFERLWRSDERPEAALQAAFGRPADVIISEWRRSIGDVPSGGPRAPASALLSSIGWATLAIGLGLLMAERRQVSM